MICVTEKLKLHRDFSKYNYLSLDSAVVNGLDDAANFRTVRVSTASLPALLLHFTPVAILTRLPAETHVDNFLMIVVLVDKLILNRKRRRNQMNGPKPNSSQAAPHAPVHYLINPQEILHKTTCWKPLEL